MRPERIAGAQGDASGDANTHAIVGIEIGLDMEAVWPKKARHKGRANKFGRGCLKGMQAIWRSAANCANAKPAYLIA